MLDVSAIPWFYCTIISVFLYGTLNFIYKLAALKGLRGSHVVNRSAITVSLWALLFILLSPPQIESYGTLILFAFLNSAFFALSSTSKLNALKYIPTSYFFPISKFSLVIVILLSLTFLGEMPLWNQWIGIGLIGGVIWLIGRDSKRAVESDTPINLKMGLLFSIFVIFGSGLSVFIGKLASTRVDKLSFIFVSYLLTMTFTFIIGRVSGGDKLVTLTKKQKKLGVLYGVLIGTLNFFGYVLVLQAFSAGPLSLIQSISSIAITIPIILSVLFLNESFNLRRLAALSLALAATVLIKLKL